MSYLSLTSNFNINYEINKKIIQTLNTIKVIKKVSNFNKLAHAYILT